MRSGPAAAIGRQDKGAMQSTTRADGTSVGHAGRTGRIPSGAATVPYAAHWREAAQANREIVPSSDIRAQRTDGMPCVLTQVPCAISAPMLITRIKQICVMISMKPNQK